MAILLAGTVVAGLFLSAPYLPTSHAVTREAVKFAALEGGETVMDLGAGDGRFLLAVRKAHPTIHAVGCELQPLVWLLGKFHIWWAGEEMEWKLGNALRQDVRGADCIFLYLSPDLLAALEEKFDRELKPGAKVITYVFRFPRRQPLASRPVPWLGDTKELWLYHW